MWGKKRAAVATIKYINTTRTPEEDLLLATAHTQAPTSTPQATSPGPAESMHFIQK